MLPVEYVNGPNRYSLLGKPKQKTRPPLRLFSELADEFGLSPQRLAAQMANSPIAHPKFSKRTCCGTYYEHAPMRAWWKAHNEAKKAACACATPTSST